MRTTSIFKHILDMDGITVTDVETSSNRILAKVKLTKSKLKCPLCGYITKVRYDTRPVSSNWRHLDLCKWRLEIQADLRRIDCPTHGIHVEGVPFARYGSRFTTDF